MIKNKKIYMICLIACIATMALGLILSGIEMVSGLGDVLYAISWILGLLVGSMKTYMDFLKWVFRKKESRLVALSIPAFIIKWYFKLCWWLIAVTCGLVICLMLPAFSGVIAFFRYKDELVEA